MGLTDGMVYADREDPKRVVFLGAMTSVFYEIVDETLRANVISAFRSLVEDWVAMGARPLATVDDDLFMVGEPCAAHWTFYLIFEIEDVWTVAAMIQRIREARNGIRMDRYARFEARIGRAFFLLSEMEKRAC